MVLNEEILHLTEETNPEISLQAYERAVGREPSCADAWINWGRLLHEHGDLEQAKRIYRRGLEQCGDEWLHFNLAVALEDQLRTNEAIDEYLMAIKCAPQFADAHFNLARLYHARADRQAALRHLACWVGSLLDDTLARLELAIERGLVGAYKTEVTHG